MRSKNSRNYNRSILCMQNKYHLNHSVYKNITLSSKNCTFTCLWLCVDNDNVVGAVVQHGIVHELCVTVRNLFWNHSNSCNQRWETQDLPPVYCSTIWCHSSLNTIWLNALSAPTTWHCFHHEVLGSILI